MTDHRQSTFTARITAEVMMVLPALSGGISPAGTISWIDSAGGLFTDPANWDFGVPGTGDLAVFDEAGTFTVLFDQNIANSDLTVRRGDVTFDLGGFTYGMSTAAGDHIRIADTSNQSATLRITHGTLGDRGMRIGLGGMGTLIIDGRDAQVVLTNTVNAGYTSHGTVLIKNGGTLTDDTGLIGLTTDGTVTVTGTGSQWINTTFLNVGGPALTFAATLDIIDGGLVTSPTTDVLRSGRITGNATIQTHVQVKGGQIRPGGASQTAALTVDGNYTNVNDVVSNLSIELGGTAPGSATYGHDVLNVTGVASLNYKLTVTLINGFSPPRGWTFDIVTAGTVAGAFSQPILPPLPNGGTFSVQYLPTKMRLVTPGQLGDATGDNQVNIDDLLGVINAWGACPPGSGAGCSGDVNGDGVINIDDLLFVINHWS